MEFVDFSKVIRRSINPFRNEHSCREMRNAVKELMKKDTGFPKWMQPLMMPAKFCYKGQYKQVYVYNNHAIAISKSPMKIDDNLKFKFESVNNNFPNTLNYPEETFKVREYYVAKLRKCDKTLIDELIAGKVGYEDQMMRLGYALRALHEKRIIVSDIKPDNILVCNGSLSFGDIDDVYDHETNKGNLRITQPYSLIPYWIEYKKGPNGGKLGILTEDHQKFLDWYAFAYCVLVSCKTKGYSERIMAYALQSQHLQSPFRMNLKEELYKNDKSIHKIVRQCCDWMLLSNGRYIDYKPMEDFFTPKVPRLSIRTPSSVRTPSSIRTPSKYKLKL